MYQYLYLNDKQTDGILMVDGCRILSIQDPSLGWRPIRG